MKFRLCVLGIVIIILCIPYIRLFFKRLSLLFKIKRVCQDQGYALRGKHFLWFLGGKEGKNCDCVIETEKELFAVKLFGMPRRKRVLVFKERKEFFVRIHSLEEAKAEASKRSEDGEFYFAIVLKETGKVIGEIVAHPETSQPDGTEHMIKDTFSPCWMLNTEYQGKGYAFEAAHAFLDYLFSKKGARRIYAYTEDYNLSSQHLCEKLGMRREGMFMEFVSFVKNPDGTPLYENTIQYAILRKEWERN